jgi:hypothetical protein
MYSVWYSAWDGSWDDSIQGARSVADMSCRTRPKWVARSSPIVRLARASYAIAWRPH